jgi:hypothetical protein
MAMITPSFVDLPTRCTLQLPSICSQHAIPRPKLSKRAESPLIDTNSTGVVAPAVTTTRRTGHATWLITYSFFGFWTLTRSEREGKRYTLMKTQVS